MDSNSSEDEKGQIDFPNINNIPNEKFQKNVNRIQMITLSKKKKTQSKNLRALEKDLMQGDVHLEELKGRDFEQNENLNVVSRQKIQHLLRKKAELDYLYIPANLRKDREQRKITICGIFNTDSGDRCRCVVF